MPDKPRKEETRFSGRDRRSSPRYRTRALTDGSVVADANGRGPSFLGTTVNISAGGVLVRTYEALTAGQDLTLTVHLPEGDLQVTGSVLHVEQDAVGCRMAGVRFGPLNDAAAAMLARHLRSFEPGGSLVPAAVAEPVAAVPEVHGGMSGDAASEGPGLRRKSLRETRAKTSVVFPFEGTIKSEERGPANGTGEPRKR